MTIEKKTFVCSDATNNNNKFWSYEYDTDTEICIVKYGRVGKTNITDDPKKMSRKDIDRKIREKLKGSGKEGSPTYKPPYREIIVISDIQMSPIQSTSKDLILEAAKQQLGAGNSELSKLIERLVESNKHELYKASGGQLNIDLKTGVISTPVGVITKDTIKQARISLDLLAPLVNKSKFDDKSFINELNTYLMLVPQMVGHSRGWHKNFFLGKNTLQHQSTLLDQLEASCDIAESRVKSTNDYKNKTDISITPNIFNTDLKIITDTNIIEMIEKKFFDSINKKHESKNMKPIKIYEVTLQDAKKAFDDDGAKLSNIQMLWHGTRIFNVLSILKNSLILPKTLSTMQICGAMFGNGIYGSDQSTKALNYARGYWDGGPRDKNCFMFLVDFAMGKSYTPKSSYETLPKLNYDSTFAKADISGVHNNEMIVYRASQINIKYLVEFEEK